MLRMKHNQDLLKYLETDYRRSNNCHFESARKRQTGKHFHNLNSQ